MGFSLSEPAVFGIVIWTASSIARCPCFCSYSRGNYFLYNHPWVLNYFTLRSAASLPCAMSMTLARVWSLLPANYAECSQSVVQKPACHEVHGQEGHRIGSAVKVSKAQICTRLMIFFSADHVCRSGNVRHWRAALLGSGKCDQLFRYITCPFGETWETKWRSSHSSVEYCCSETAFNHVSQDVDLNLLQVCCYGGC